MNVKKMEKFYILFSNNNLGISEKIWGKIRSCTFNGSELDGVYNGKSDDGGLVTLFRRKNIAYFWSTHITLYNTQITKKNIDILWHS